MGVGMHYNSRRSHLPGWLCWPFNWCVGHPITLLDYMQINVSIVNIMKVYIKRHDLQLELIQYSKQCWLYSRLLAKRRNSPFPPPTGDISNTLHIIFPRCYLLAFPEGFSFRATHGQSVEQLRLCAVLAPGGTQTAIIIGRVMGIFSAENSDITLIPIEKMCVQWNIYITVTCKMNGHWPPNNITKNLHRQMFIYLLYINSLSRL